jgi:predicted dehydrogenase
MSVTSYAQSMVLRVGLIGVGAMGSNHARIIHESSRAQLTKVFDLNERAADKAARQWGADAARQVDELSECDAVVIASSTTAHHSLGSTFALQDKAILIEKPLCASLEETRDLLSLCEKRDIALCCGFVERFNPAVVTALKLIDGPVRHLMTYRHSPYNPRASSSVVTDLLIHDLDFTARLAPTNVPDRVGAALWAPSKDGYIETADCSLQFGNQMTAMQSASRWGQRKIRDIKISTDELLLELDLIRVTVTAYRHRSPSPEAQGDPVSYRSETMIEIPFVRHAGEPLALQFDHFVDLATGISDRTEERRTIEAPHVLAELVTTAR